MSFFPIAHAAKTFRENTQAIPLLEYESLVLIKLDSNNNGFWLLTCGFSGVRTAEESKPIGISSIYDIASQAEIDAMKRLGKSVHSSDAGTVVSRKCLSISRNEPSLQEIREFLYKTDFGNNNIFPMTDFASLYNCETPFVTLNDSFKDLHEALNVGLLEEMLLTRKKVYNRALVGNTSSVIVGSRGR